MAPDATQRPFSRIRKSLATRRRERQLLLDEQHRDARTVLIEPQDDAADLVHDVRLDPLGRLVQDQQARLEHERAADRELLLLAAARDRRRAASASWPAPGTVRRSAAARRAATLGRTPRPTRRFSSTVSCGKISAALRHEADARAWRAPRRPARPAAAPSNSIWPDATGSRPMMHFSSVVLPMPLRPIRHVREPTGTAMSMSHSVWLPPYVLVQTFNRQQTA